MTASFIYRNIPEDFNPPYNHYAVTVNGDRVIGFNTEVPELKEYRLYPNPLFYTPADTASAQPSVTTEITEETVPTPNIVDVIQFP